MSFLFNNSSAISKNPHLPYGMSTKIQKIGKNFEEIFLKNSFEILNKNISDDPLLGGGFAEKMYSSLLNDYLAKEIAQGAGIGIAPLVVKELIKLQQS